MGRTDVLEVAVAVAEPLVLVHPAKDMMVEVHRIMVQAEAEAHLRLGRLAQALTLQLVREAQEATAYITAISSTQMSGKAATLQEAEAAQEGELAGDPEEMVEAGTEAHILQALE